MLDEVHFILSVSPYLQQFKKLSNGGYAFRCPFCGDSAKNKYKTRGSLFRHQGSYMFNCYNCAVPTSFYNFLKFIDESVAKEYSIAKFLDEKGGSHRVIRPSSTKATIFESDKILPSELFPKVSSLGSAHDARIYLGSRKVEKLDRVVYAHDPDEWIRNIGKVEVLGKGPRIGFPLVSSKGVEFGIQFRTLNSKETKNRFQTVIFREGFEKSYGIENINKDALTLYVVEGAIDSLMLDNSVASLDASLHSTAKNLDLDKMKTTLIFDNEPRNRQVVSNMEKAIADDWNVVIWPKSIKQKDLNQIVTGGGKLDFIEENTYKGLTARLQLTSWKNI